MPEHVLIGKVRTLCRNMLERLSSRTDSCDPCFGMARTSGFMAMTLTPTDDQLKTLQSVEQSIAGIDAVPNKEIGFDCVICGWLEHRAHRREDGGLIDVWRLTEEGRRVLESSAAGPSVAAA